MKHILLILSLAAMIPLSSCTTYLDGGYATARPGYRPGYGYRPAPPRAYPASYSRTHYYNSRYNRHDHHDHDHNRSYHRVNKKPRGPWSNSNANVRVQTNMVRLNTNAGLRM